MYDYCIIKYYKLACYVLRVIIIISYARSNYMHVSDDKLCGSKPNNTMVLKHTYLHAYTFTDKPTYTQVKT